MGTAQTLNVRPGRADEKNGMHPFVRKSMAVLSPLLLSACSLLSDRHRGPEVELTQDAWVTVGEQAPQAHKKDERLTLGERPMWIEAPEHHGVLLVPRPYERDETIQIRLKPVSERMSAPGSPSGPQDSEQAAEDSAQARAEAILSDLFPQIELVQDLLVDKKTEEALARVEQMRGKYPRIVQLRVLRASCLVVAGKQRDARRELKAILSETPTNESARRLFESISESRKKAKP